MAPMPGSARKPRRQSIFTMDEWVAEFIKRIILRMPIPEVIPTLKTWGFLEEAKLQSLNPIRIKDSLAMEIVHLCESREATIDHAADLDIVYTHANSKKKNWEVYQMSIQSDSEENLADVSKFRVRFKKAVQSVHRNISIHFKEFGDTLWIRIAWGKGIEKPNQYRPTFAVYHAQTPYVFVTSLWKTQQPAFYQGLLSATGYSHMQEMELKSRCLDSLKEIVFKKFSQGNMMERLRTHNIYSSITRHLMQKHSEGLVLNVFSRWEKSSGNPELVALYHEQLFDKPFQSYQSRSIPEKSFTPAIVDPKVVYENIADKERVHHVMRETFGEGPLPKMEYAVYKMVTSFKGETSIANKIEPFRCTVKFSSPHLLESLRNLAPSGLAEAPISNLLTCIPQRGRNIFKISEKKQPSSSQAIN